MPTKIEYLKIAALALSGNIEARPLKAGELAKIIVALAECIEDENNKPRKKED